MKVLLLTVICFTFRLSLAGEEKYSESPLWELGLIGGIISTPDYPGSNQDRLRFLGFPNFRYRGKIIRSEENEGTRARIIRDPIFKLDFSFSFNFDVDSDENNTRQGMRDIDFVGEFGPRGKIRLLDEKGDGIKLELIFPLRAVFMSNLKYFQDRGFTFSPGIQMGKKDVFCTRCQIFFRTSALFADERYLDLFYQVGPQFVRSNRPYYNAKAGFQGMNIFTGYALRVGKIQAFLGVNYTNYSGATNRASPLIRQNSNLTYILGLGWLFWESKDQGFQ